MNNNETLDRMEILFLALADKTRLRILNLLRESEVCVYLFTDILGESQPKISRHLAYLRNAGIVESRREGKLIYYKITELSDKFASQVLIDILNWLDSQETMQSEYNQLKKTYSDKQLFSNLEESSETNTYAETYASRPKEELEIFLL